MIFLAPYIDPTVSFWSDPFSFSKKFWKVPILPVHFILKNSSQRLRQRWVGMSFPFDGLGLIGGIRTSHTGFAIAEQPSKFGVPSTHRALELRDPYQDHDQE